MVARLGVPQTVAVKNCKDDYGAYISCYKTLKMLYEDHLYVATRLIGEQTMEQIQEMICVSMSV